MQLWKLSVLDPRTLDWELSIFKGGLIVRAKREHQARKHATSEFAVCAEGKPGQHTKINPWSQKHVVACEPYSGSEFQVDGQPNVLARL